MRIGLVIGTTLLALAAPAHAGDWDFVLVNLTGKTIKEVELSPSGAGSWTKWRTEEDRPSEVKPGEDYTVHFRKDDNACRFDVRLTFGDGTTATAPGLNVCDNAFADFSFTNGTLAVKGS